MNIPTLPPGSGFPPRGLYRCSDATYHAMPGLSSTRIKRMARSPREFRDQFDAPDEDTDSKRFGRGLHCLSLEGRAEFDRRFVRMPAGELRGAEKVTAWRQRCTDILGGPVDWPSDAPGMRQAFIDAAAARGLDVVDDDWVATMEAMHANALANPNVAALLSGEGLSEVCLFDEWTGTDDDGQPWRFRVRGKLDRIALLGGKPFGLDPKTIPSFGVGEVVDDDGRGNRTYRWRDVERYMRTYGLAIQCAFYSRLWAGLSDVHGMDRELNQTFCFLEKDHPHRCLWASPHADNIESASVRISEWLGQISRCRRTGTWPGIPHGLQSILL